MERRTHQRVNLKLECLLERSGGDVFRGNTRNLSDDGAEMESNDFCVPGRKPLKVGDVGVFTFSFRKGPNVDSIKVTARIVWVMGSSVGLNLLVSELFQHQRENMSNMLESGSGKIE
jgi:hypothetical protein